MARVLSTAVANIEPPSSDYPSGRVRNSATGVAGTSVIEELYGDVIQFFEKMIRDAGITKNNLPDNEANGFQLLQALDERNIVATRLTGTISDARLSSNVALLNAQNVFSVLQTISRNSDQQLRLGYNQSSINPYLGLYEGTNLRASLQYVTTSNYLALINHETGEQLRIASGLNGLEFFQDGNGRIVYHSGNLPSELARTNQENTFTVRQTIQPDQDEQLRLGHNRTSRSPSIGFYEGTSRRAAVQYDIANNRLRLLNDETDEEVRVESGVNGLKFVEGGASRTVYHEGNHIDPSAIVTRQRVSNAVSGNFSILTINWNGRQEFETTAIQVVSTIGIVNVIYANESNASHARLHINVPSGFSILHFPAGTTGENGDNRWAPLTLNLVLDAGQYEIEISKVGSIYRMRCSNQFTPI